MAIAYRHMAQLLGAMSAHARDRVGMAKTIEGGLSWRALDRVKHALGLTDEELAAYLGMSPKTLGRIRTARRRLDAVVSDRLYRLARVFVLAEETLESAEGARAWLRAPQVGLGMRSPLELVRTEAGTREVEELLGRIEHGVGT